MKRSNHNQQFYNRFENHEESNKRNAHGNQRLQSSANQSMSLANSGKHLPTIEERMRLNQEKRMRHEGETNFSRRPPINKAEKQPKKQRKQPKKKRHPILEQLFPSNKDILSAPDSLVLEVTLIILAIGLVMVFSASSYRSLLENGSAFTYLIRQSVYAFLGIVALLVVTRIEPRAISAMAFPILLVVIALIAYTAFNGEETLGATRWISIGGIRFTPAEFAKPVIVLCLADLIQYNPADIIKSRHHLGIFALLVITLGLIVKEDLGSGLTIFGGCFAMLIVAGISKRTIFATMGAGVLFAVGAVILEPYRLQRIFGFLNQGSADAASGSAYQLTQSLYAFGSGGLIGVGIGNSGQKLLYLPGMHTDFIYSVIGEELGLIGAVLVLILFMTFAWRGFWLAWRIEDNYKSYVAFGITAMIVVQALINMGVAVGVLPVTGITLPLISYGGTSVLITLISIGLLLNMSRFADKKNKR